MNASKLLNIVLALALIIVLIWNPLGKKQSSDSGETTAADTEAAVLSTIHNRKSVRHFTDQTLTRDQLETLARAAMAAPSARNAQPWAVIAIDNRPTLDSLAEVLPFAKMLAQAPAAFIICGDMNKALDGKGAEYWIQDCSAATENLLIAAEGMGLGAVWTGVYPIDERIAEVRNVVALPDHITPLCVIPVGYPTGEDMPKDKWIPENYHINAW